MFLPIQALLTLYLRESILKCAGEPRRGLHSTFDSPIGHSVMSAMNSADAEAVMIREVLKKKVYS